MENRFKFRVWDKIDKRFMSGTVLMDSRKGYLSGNIPEVSYVIQQCTGLKDKNGKLIYEGDILQHPQLSHRFICEWFKCGFWINFGQNGAKRLLSELHNSYEVIGNIYENKELLNGNKN